MLTVLKNITPSSSEKKVILDSANNFIKKLNAKSKEGKAILGGSVAKGTWLNGDYDIDIFVVFDKKYEDKDISKMLENKLKSLKPIKISGIRKVHGSRDYFQIRHDPFNFEIVPILKINKAKEAKNITDVSPLHTKWLKKNSNKKLLNEIRLVKTFCKANKLYGAESYIKGFSGYTLEVLTVYYGSFSRLIKNIAKWKKGKVVDIEKHFDGLNESKKGPLIVIDPVQADRNTAAAVSDKKFELFVDLAKKFNRNPNVKYFERGKLDLDDLKGAVILKVKPFNGKEDVVGSKLLKALEFIGKRMKEEGYKIDSYDWEWDEFALFWYYVRNKNLPKKYKHFGPPVKEDAHLDKFKEKYKRNKLFMKGNKVYVELERKNPYVLDFLRVLKKHSYLKDKVKEVRILKE